MPCLRRFLHLLHYACWEFWLPLPLAAALFWMTGDFMAAKVLSRPYDSATKLQAYTQLDMRLSVTSLTMTAEIDRSRRVTTVFVKTTESTSNMLEYEFPVIQASQVEAAVAQKLAIPVENVRKLISYRMVN